MKRRSAFTLIEVLVVLALLALTAAAAIPAFAAAQRDPVQRGIDELASLLRETRDAARESGRRAELSVSISDGRYWLVSARGTATGSLGLDPGVRLVGIDGDRVTCAFSPVGTVSPCAFAARGSRDVIVRVDPWTGDIHTGPRTR